MIDLLRENFRYEDGQLYWTTAGAQRKAGKRAGSPDSRGYLKVQFQRKSYYVHRVVWALHHGVWPTQIDHVNRDKKDNRIENLREATQSLNNFNRVMPSLSQSGHVGVELQVTGRFRARAGRVGLGTYATPEEASAAREAYLEGVS